MQESLTFSALDARWIEWNVLIRNRNKDQNSWLALHFPTATLFKFANPAVPMHWKSVITQYCLWRVNFPFVANFMVPKVIIRIRIDSRITYHLGGVAWQLNVPLLVSLFRTNGKPANTKHLKQPTKTITWFAERMHTCVCRVAVCYFISVVGNSENRKRQWYPRTTWDIHFFTNCYKVTPPRTFRKSLKRKLTEWP